MSIRTVILARIGCFRIVVDKNEGISSESVRKNTVTVNLSDDSMKKRQHVV